MTASAFDIAASGMAAHRTEMDLIAENIANAGVARADGSAFRPRTAVFEPAGGSSFASALESALGTDATEQFGFDAFGTAGDAGSPFGVAQFDAPPPQPVRLAGVAALPGDAADDSIGQMVSLVAAGRAYDADVAALQAAKQMDVEAIDVDRT